MPHRLLMSAPRTSRRAEWLALAITFVLATSILGEANSIDRETISTVQDDIDDFRPYQGERFNDFDWNLLKNMARDNNGNLLLSPVSLKLSLVQLYEGAQNATAKELVAAMNLPRYLLLTRAKFATLLQSLKTKNPAYEIDIGTNIFMDSSLIPRQLYTSILKTFYSTNVVSTNFSDTRSSAQLINNFVSDVTKKHIDNLIGDDSVLKDNVMFIVNALYFKGSWLRQPFSANDTKIQPFYLADGKTVQVPLMQATRKFYFADVESLDAKILRLPYGGHKFAMYIILPRLPGRVKEVLEKITPANINTFVSLLEEVPVDVLLPKFKIEFGGHLKKALRELGIRDIFEETASLTGILRSKSTSSRLTVTDIAQKVGIEVSEQGTVAYTATEIEIGNKINDETFHANHAFLFYIEDEITGTILYMGVVNKPHEETGMPGTEASEPRGSAGTQTPGETLPAPQMPLNFSDRLGEDPERGGSPGVDPRTQDEQNLFSLELLQKLGQAHPGNLVVGSSSVKTALMIMAEAAAGQTYRELESALHLLPDIGAQRNAAFYSIAPIQDAPQSLQLQNAIKLWLASDVRILKSFEYILNLFYQGDAQSVDFNNVDETTKTINEWVSRFTHGRIGTIVDPGSLDPETIMVLTSAVYFKGAWLHGFDKRATESTCFDVPGVGCKKVPLMEHIADYNNGYVAEIDCDVVQIPYAENKASLLILLPAQKGAKALEDALRKLTSTPVSTILKNLEESELVLQIPRFSIGSKLDLKDPLRELGIRDLFLWNANLTKAFPPNPIKVGSVIHNAQIDVNEEGTVASAVTGISVMPLMGTIATTFRVDRPFIFLLLDNQTNSILFAGRFVQPDTQTLSSEVKA